MLHCGKQGWSSKASESGKNLDKTRGFRGQALAAVFKCSAAVRIASTTINSMLMATKTSSKESIASLGPANVPAAAGEPAVSPAIEFTQAEQLSHGCQVQVFQPFITQPVRLKSSESSEHQVKAHICKQLRTLFALHPIHRVKYTHNGSQVMQEQRPSTATGRSNFDAWSLERLLGRPVRVQQRGRAPAQPGQTELQDSFQTFTGSSGQIELRAAIAFGCYRPEARVFVNTHEWTEGPQLQRLLGAIRAQAEHAEPAPVAALRTHMQAPSHSAAAAAQAGDTARVLGTHTSIVLHVTCPATAVEATYGPAKQELHITCMPDVLQAFCIGVSGTSSGSLVGKPATWQPQALVRQAANSCLPCRPPPPAPLRATTSSTRIAQQLKLRQKSRVRAAAAAASVALHGREGGAHNARAPLHPPHCTIRHAAAEHTHHTLSASMLRSARVIGQLDGKYIVLNTAPLEEAKRWAGSSTRQTGIVQPAAITLLDQHAVHERIRYECMAAQLQRCVARRTAQGVPAPAVLCSRERASAPVGSPASALLAREKLGTACAAARLLIVPPQAEDGFVCCSRRLPAPLRLHPDLGSTAAAHTELLQAIGIKTKHVHGGEVCVVGVPTVFGVPLSAADALGLLEQLRVTPQLGTAACTGFHCLRRAVQGKACRGAIMFNQQLSMHDMQGLLGALVRTSAPMQCAHGRPAGVPVYLDEDASN